jgi:hypothetical protein
MVSTTSGRLCHRGENLDRRGMSRHRTLRAIH